MGWRIAPFVAAGILPFALVPVAGLSFADPRVAIAAAMVPIVVGLVLLVPWERLPAWPQAILPLSYFVVIALLRDAGGSTPSVFDPLLVIPIAWFAIYGTGRELALSVVGMGITLALPMILPGHMGYDGDQLLRVIVAVVIAGTVGPAVHALVVALRRTTSELSEAEERFRRAFDDSQVGMGLVSPAGRFQRVNRAFCELTGYPERELLGRTFSEITHPDDVEAELDALRELLDGERYGYRAEKRYIHADGHPIWTSLTVSPVYETRRNDQLPDQPGRGHLGPQGVRGATHAAGAPRFPHRAAQPDSVRRPGANGRESPGVTSATRSSTSTSTASSWSTTPSVMRRETRC